MKTKICLLLALDNISDNWLCEVSADECSAVLDSDKGNFIPDNIRTLPVKVLTDYLPTATFLVGKHSSRVLYVRDLVGGHSDAEFDAAMRTIGELYKADESKESSKNNLFREWRFWWD